MSKASLFTIGYEQARPDAVLEELKRARIELLIDTRAVRRPGGRAFPNASLPPHSMRTASPICICRSSARRQRVGRRRARGDLDKLWRIYDKHLKTPDAKEAMDELIALVKSGRRLCLLCYERDPAECHRSRIAEVVHERTGTRAEDLVPALF